MGRGPNWTPDEDAALLLMAEDNFSSKTMASRLGRSVHGCESRLWILRKLDAGVPMRSHEVKPESASKPAQEAPPRAKSKQAMRPCLGGCGKSFMSDHSGNRICPRCRSRQRDAGPYAH